MLKGVNSVFVAYYVRSAEISSGKIKEAGYCVDLSMLSSGARDALQSPINCFRSRFLLRFIYSLLPYFSPTLDL